MKEENLIHKGHSIKPYPSLFFALLMIFFNIMIAIIWDEKWYIMIGSLFLFSFLYVYYCIRNYYIYEDEIIVKNFNKKYLFSIPYNNLKFVYYYDMDSSSVYWSMNARLFDHNNKLVFTLTFSEPDGEDFIKVIKHIQYKGVKIKIDKRTKFEPILKAFGKMK